MNNKWSKRLLIVPVVSILSASCAGGSAPTDADSLPTYSVTLSWNANLERAVNMGGGGYELQYIKYENSYEGFSNALDDAMNGVWDESLSQTRKVSYFSGSTAPTTATISGLSSGYYRFRLSAYSKVQSETLQSEYTGTFDDPVHVGSFFDLE